MFEKILIVCTGNICRSPMAESLMANTLRGRAVASAGTHALIGQSAHRFAISTCAGHGLDLTAHVSRQLRSQDLWDADLILVMDQSHLDWIRRHSPAHAGKTFKLRRWVDNQDVPDPVRSPEPMFRHIFEEMRAAAEKWYEKIS